MRDEIKQPTLLAGTWVGPAGDEWFEDLDPADTRRVIALLPRLSREQVRHAIDAAEGAAPEWAGVSPIDRGRILLDAGRLLRDRVDGIAEDICHEAGKLMAEARGEVLKSADFLEYYAGLGRAFQGEVLPDERSRTSVAHVRDLDEAVERVNDSAYGLSAAVFTRDLASAMEFARRVETGQVAINRPTSGWDVHLPFGGFKDSGSTSKEQGTDGLDFYTRTKTVAVGY